MLLLAPLGIRALAASAGRAPVAVRLALRDLARYQARSGAALAAASLAVGIAATIAISAAAAAGARPHPHRREPADQSAHRLGAATRTTVAARAQSSPPGAVAATAAGPSPAVVASARSDRELDRAGAERAAPSSNSTLRSNLHSDAPAGAPPDASQANLVHPITENGPAKGFTPGHHPVRGDPGDPRLLPDPRRAIEPSSGHPHRTHDLSGTRSSAPASIAATSSQSRSRCRSCCRTTPQRPTH